VHAQAIGHPLLGDKIYGPDETLFLEFIEHGWTPRHDEMLGWRRQALHCMRVEFEDEKGAGKQRYQAPLARDIQEFCEKRLGFSAPDYLAFE
jgi:23S rRNA pseudouridine1911/1915/1917 synthase